MFPLKLRDGTEVRITMLECRPTYSGLIEGRPTRELNEQYLERLAAEACKFAGMPVRSLLSAAPDGVRMPEVACIAELEEGLGWLRIV